MSILEIYYRHYGNVSKKKIFVKSFRSCNDVGAAIANRILSNNIITFDTHNL